MITGIATIKLSGIKYPVYSVDFSGGGEDASSLSVNFVNKDGVYANPELQTKTPTTVTIGSFFSFVGFPVTSEIDEKPDGGNILTVNYKDTSIILDNYYVGLKGKFGAGFESKVRGDFTNIILVGRQVDPCSDIQPEDQYDPFSPCKKRDNEYQKKLIDCAALKSLKLLDTVYSFNELLDEIEKFVKLYNRPQTLNTNYYSRYTGTLREVLKRWSSDYGFTFFWDKDGIRFLDLRKGIDINDSNFVETCTLLSRKTKKSIEGNVNRGTIIYFGKEGAVNDYDCGDNDPPRRLTLRPLTLKDIFIAKRNSSEPLGSNNYGDQEAIDPTIKEYYGKDLSTDETIESFEEIASLGNYSTHLRDLFILYFKEGITTAAVAEDKIGEKIGLFGNFEIKDVYHKYSEDANKSSIYNRLMNKYTKKIQEELKHRKVYFIKAKRDPELWEKFKKLETGLASDYMGKYWLRYYTGPPNVVPSISAPDGSPRYFKEGQEFQLPFLDILPSSTKQAKSIFSDILQRGENGTFANDSFILLERPPAWHPMKNSPRIEKLIEYINQIQFTDIGGDDVAGIIEGTSESIYMVSEKPENNKFDILGPIKDTNPTDAENVDIQTIVGNYSTSYGLRNARCHKYTVKTAMGDTEIFTPSQSYDFGSTHGGYVVIVDNSRNKNKARNISKKIEKVLGNVKRQENSIGIDINYRDATQNIFKILKYHVDDDDKYTPDMAEYNEDIIDGLMDDFSKGLDEIKNITREEITYVVGGIPSKKKTLSDGLQSFNIRYGGSDGVRTYATFSNLPKQKYSESIIIKEIEKNNSIAGILNKEKILNQMTAPLLSTEVGVDEIID